jgi:hypothetical protein
MHNFNLIAANVALGFIICGLYLRFKTKGQDNVSPFIFLGLFICGSATLIQDERSFAFFFLVNLFWLPLAIDDYFTKSVSLQALLIATTANIATVFIFKENTLSYMLIWSSILLALRICVAVFETLFGKQLIGGADYIAAFAFISTLKSNLLGYWLILFSLLGILHAVKQNNKTAQIPLIPFMLAGWALTFAISSAGSS